MGCIIAIDSYGRDHPLLNKPWWIMPVFSKIQQWFPCGSFSNVSPYSTYKRKMLFPSMIDSDIVFLPSCRFVERPKGCWRIAVPFQQESVSVCLFRWRFFSSIFFFTLFKTMASGDSEVTFKSGAEILAVTEHDLDGGSPEHFGWLSFYCGWWW